MKIIKAVDEFLAKFETAVLVTLLSSMIVLSFLQVVLRNFWHTGIVWGDILLRHLVLLIGLPAASLATRIEKHIHIDALNRIMTPVVRTLSLIFTNLFAAVVVFFLAQASYSFMQLEVDLAETIFLNIPTWYVGVVITWCFGMMTFRFLLNAVKYIMRASHHEWVTEEVRAH